MNLLKENKLIWSTTVANCNMNRKRNLLGVNSYEKDIDFNVLDFIYARIDKGEKVNWIDICCGEGKALIQANYELLKKGIGDNVELEGMDLVDMFDEYNPNHIKMIIGSLLNWQPDKKYDLITCVHGLHYIGDKLLAIQKILTSLKEDGVFIANISFANVRNEQNKSLEKELLKYLKKEGLTYNSKKKILSCRGNKNLHFPYQYLGADDKVGKNYTGQEVVNSIYTLS